MDEETRKHIERLRALLREAHEVLDQVAFAFGGDIRQRIDYLRAEIDDELAKE